MFKLMILLFSLSVRTANMPEMPLDYEVKGGIKRGDNTISFLRERENGKAYRGRDTNLQYSILEFRDYSRTAKGIDTQSLALLKGWEHLSMGASVGLHEWKEPEGLGVVKYKRKFVSVRYSANSQSQYLDVDLSYEIPLTPRLSLMPLILIRDYNNLFWQSKIQIEIKL